MRSIVLLTVVLAWQSPMSAQKIQDPGLPKSSHPDPAALAVPRHHSSVPIAVYKVPSTSEVEKIEQKGIKSPRVRAHKPRQASAKSYQAPVPESSTPQSSGQQNRKLKSRYQPPRTGTKPVGK